MKNKKDIYWKSIEEFKNAKPFKEAAKNEFPDNILEAPSKMSRKKFLSIMGASIALASLSSCRKPVQKIIPYVNHPEEIIPGIPRYYATTMPFGLNSYGVIVESHEGRPTHIEGNANHLSTQGSTNSFIQASILDLYDPDRSKSIRYNGKRSSWKKLTNFLNENKAKKSAILSSSFASPSISKIKKDLKGKVDWYCYDPAGNENEHKGIRQALVSKQLCFAEYDFEKADTILSIDSDFLNIDENPIKNTKGFSKRRKAEFMNRLYVVEGNLTITGAMSDHRKILKHSDIEKFVLDMYNHFNKKSSQDPWIIKVYNDLKKSNTTVIKGGSRLSIKAHEMIVRMNKKLGNLGETVNYTPFANTDIVPSNFNNYAALLDEIKKGNIEHLYILDSNPVYFDQNFKEALDAVELSVHLGLHYDETAAACNWHIPKTHYLESWGDCVSLDGTISIIQPLISPLYKECYSELDFLSLIQNPSDSENLNPMGKAYKIIKNTYRKKWDKSLYNGIVGKAKKHTPIKSFKLSTFKNKGDENLTEGLELVFYLSSQVYDGRFANNAWLQETPDSISKVTWDNVAIISNKTAKELNINNKQIISLSYKGAAIEIPAWILPGHADSQISLQLGYGRDFKSTVAKSVGENTYQLMKDSKYSSPINKKNIRAVDKFATIACTQDHHGMDVDDSLTNNEVQKRLPDIYRELTKAEYDNGGAHKIQDIDKHKHLELHHSNDYDSNDHTYTDPEELKTLYTNPYEKFYRADHISYDKPYDPTDPPQWGMTIDLNTCTGCNACSIACQSENNIPTVGKEQVEKGREMSWIRTDRYFKGDVENPDVAFQPVPCMQCENAPCEQVCPVSATVHDKEGLNAMVYNRCIGTRYCSNNCPYKVRRFNFHNNTYDTPEIVQMAHNPDVTIRFRGVMEKCTFCVQRIKEVEHKSKVEKKNLNDYNLKTACQSACPADSIVFGNIRDMNEDKNPIYKTKKSDRNYSLLAQLNTRPRTTYLAKLRNPNEELKS